MKGVSLSLIGTNTVATVRYVFNQLSPGCVFSNRVDESYSGLQLDWYNPRPKYAEHRNTCIQNANELNCLYTHTA